MNLYDNFDLNRSVRTDDVAQFFDTRGFIGLSALYGSWSAVGSVNFAGDDFSDGVLWGNDQAPLGAAGTRRFETTLRHLYIQYHSPERWKIEMGRLPHKLGQGIVTNVIRDSIRVTEEYGKLRFVQSYVKGGEGLSPGTTTTASIVPSNAATGAGEDLHAFVLLINYLPNKEWGIQTFYAQQIDTTFDGRFPEKQFGDINANFQRGNYKVIGEFAYLGGMTSRVAALNQRRNYRAFMGYMNFSYSLPKAILGVAGGIGSGDNNPTDLNLTNFENLFMDETGYNYTFLFADDIHGFAGQSSHLGRGSGFANVMFPQIYGVLPKGPLTLKGSYTWLQATESQLEGSGVLGTVSTTNANRTRDIGHEWDILADYKLNKYLTLFFHSGYFLPGRIFGSGADPALKLETGVTFAF